MEVAFYHDDPTNRIAAAYDPQSSPGSVDSISSTDAGPVSAIAAVPPAYRDHRFGQDFAKTAILKGMNLHLQQSASSPYSLQQQQQLGCKADVRYNNTLLNDSGITSNVTNDNFHNTANTYAAVNEQTSVPTCVGAASANNLSLNIPDNIAISTSSLSTPDLVNMLKVGSPDFDQMLTQYSQAGPQVSSQIYSRNLTQEQEMYAQNYARELERQKTHGGSNSDLASSNNNPAGSSSVDSSQCSAITSGTNVVHQHPHQQHFVAPDPYYARESHHDVPSTSGFGVPPGSTIHHMGNPNVLHPGHSVLMSPHGSLAQMKEELPQTVPVSKTPPMSPINMEHQEVIKTERKRMRNRLAASKCRKRKLERISRLEEKVNGLKTQNLELSTNANLLRQQVAELKSKVMAHVNSGCQLMMSQQQVTF